MNEVPVDSDKIEQVSNALADEIEQGFNRAFKKLGEIVIEAKKTYAEHKDEIDAEVKKQRLEREQLQASMPKILVGDIVRIKSIHCRELKCYEVSRVEFNGVVSQPAGFRHDYNDIVAVYRFDGTDFKCIWEREDYTECKG